MNQDAIARQQHNFLLNTANPHREVYSQQTPTSGQNCPMHCSCLSLGQLSAIAPRTYHLKDGNRTTLDKASEFCRTIEMMKYGPNAPALGQLMINITLVLKFTASQCPCEGL